MLDTQQLRLAFVTATQGLADNLGQLTKDNTARFGGFSLTELSADILLGTVANAGTLGQLTYQSLVDAYAGESSDLSDIEAQLAAFIARRDNPHLVTQEQLDLGNLVNQGFATLAEADLGVADKYINPAMVKRAVDQAIDSLVGTAPEAMDSIQELAQILQNNTNMISDLITQVSGLISIVDAQALMTNVVTQSKLYTDGLMPTKLAGAITHSDNNVGTLAGFFAELADQFKMGFDILVPFEAFMVTGSKVVGSSTFYGYVANDYGRVSNNVWSEGVVVSTFSWSPNEKKFSVVLNGVANANLSATAIVVNGVVFPYLSTSVFGNTTTLSFNAVTGVMPTAVGFGLAVKVISAVPKTIEVPVFEAQLTIGSTMAVTGNTMSYGYRDPAGTYPIGAISKTAWPGGFVLSALNWFEHTRDLRLTIEGNALGADVPTLMVGDVVLTCKNKYYSASQNKSTYFFPWKEALPTSGTHTVRVFMKSATLPTFTHETAIVVGSKVLQGNTFIGYRDPTNEGMGSIGSPNYRGTNKIYFAQWNVNVKQMTLYILGDVRDADIKEVEYDGIRINNRTIHDLYNATIGGWMTRHVFDVTDLTQPLAAGETVYLRF